MFAVSVTCLAVRYIGNYFYGYSGMMMSHLALPVIFTLVEYLMFPMMLFAWIIAMVRKKDRSWTSRVIVIYLIWIFLTCLLPRQSEATVLGMRDRITKDYGVEKLREFARDFDQLPRLSKYSSGSYKIYPRTDLFQTGLAQKYPFLAWRNISESDMGPAFIEEENGVIDVRWGETPSDHWGFSVALDGRTLDPPPGQAAKILKVSDDVYFVQEHE